MTKFALVALSQATRQGGWEHGVRCTALCPGYVATDLTRGIDSVPFEEMTSPKISRLLLERFFRCPTQPLLLSWL